MGANASSINNQKYDNTVINRNDLTVMNEVLNNYTTSTIMSNAAACSAGITQMQVIDMSGASVAGDFNANIDQEQSAALSFECIQTANISSDIANGILDKMLNAISSSFDNSVLDKINAQSTAESTSGFLSTDIAGQTNSTVNIDYKNTTLSESRKNISNIVKNSISNNLDMKNIQDCINQIKQQQTVNFSNMNIGGNATIGIKQNQATQMVSKCVQNSNFTNKIINQVVKDLGLTIDEQSKTAKTTDVTAETSVSKTSSGIFESAGNMVNSVFSGVGNLVGNIFGSFTGPILIVVVLCILCCSFISLMLVVGVGSSSDETIKGGYNETPFSIHDEFSWPSYFSV